MAGFVPGQEVSGNFEPQQAAAPTPAKPGHPPRIILLVEATAAAATNSKTARKWIDVLLKRIDLEARGAEQSGGQPADDSMPKVQYGLIVYGSWDHSTQAPIQFSSWCSTLPELLDWLNGVQFVGGNPNKGTALTEALAQAIIMSKCPYPDGSQPAPAGRGWREGCVTKGCNTHWLEKLAVDAVVVQPPPACSEGGTACRWHFGVLHSFWLSVCILLLSQPVANTPSCTQCALSVAAGHCSASHPCSPVHTSQFTPSKSMPPTTPPSIFLHLPSPQPPPALLSRGGRPHRPHPRVASLLQLHPLPPAHPLGLRARHQGRPRQQLLPFLHDKV